MSNTFKILGGFAGGLAVMYLTLFLYNADRGLSVAPFELANGDQVVTVNPNQHLSEEIDLGHVFSNDYENKGIKLRAYGVTDANGEPRNYILVQVENEHANVTTKFVQFPQHPQRILNDETALPYIGALEIIATDLDRSGIYSRTENSSTGTKTYSINIPPGYMEYETLYILTTFPQELGHLGSDDQHRPGHGVGNPTCC